MRKGLALLFLVYSFVSFGLSLKPNAPKTYTVRKGDTLWLIANRYLSHPWEWKQLWQNNPHIHQPNALKAGDIIHLNFSGQQPYLQIVKNGMIKLSPHPRTETSTDIIPAIPLSVIKPFLNESQILNQNHLKKAPYIIGFQDEHMLAGPGDTIYVKQLYPSPPIPKGTTQSFALFRPGKAYVRPRTNEIIGFQANILGHADLAAIGNPATLTLTDVRDGISINDKVLLNHFPEFDDTFLPKAPIFPIRAHIIDLLDNYTQGAVGLVAVIDAGEDIGLEAGDVLAIFAKRRAARDPQHKHALIPLPKERIGEVMIFKVFDKTAYGLVVRSTRAIHSLDSVTNP